MLVVDVINLSSSAETLLRARVLEMRRRGIDNRIICMDGPYVAGLRAAGIPVHTVALPRGLDPLRLCLALVQIAGYLRRESVDVVHTHCSVPGVIGRLAARLAGVPVVIHTVHGFHFHERSPWHRRWPAVVVERLCGGLTDTLLTQNHADLAQAERFGIGPRERRAHIGNGIDLSRFARRNGRPHEPRPLTVLCVARLEPVKNHPLVFEAVRRLRDEGVPVRLRLVGEGPLREAYRERCRRLGIEDQVEFLGYRQDVPELLAASDVAVLPSLKEGIPRAVLEAMAAGLPVVATDVTGTREAVRDGETGFLVPLGDSAPMAAALGRLARDPALRARLGERGREVVRAEFDERPITAALERIYRERVGAWPAREWVGEPSAVRDAADAVEAGAAEGALTGGLEPSAPGLQGTLRMGRNFVYRSVSQTASALINVGAMVLLGRHLAAAGYGRYSYYYALIPLLASLCEAGIGMVVARDVARDQRSGARTLGDALLVRAATAVVVVVVALALVPRLASPGELVLLGIVVAASLLDYSQDLWVWVLRGSERLDLEARLLMTSQIIWVALIAVGIVLHAGLTALLAAAVVAFAARIGVGAWIVVRNLYRPVFEFDPARLRAMLSQGLPFGLALFGFVLYGRIGLLMLHSMSTAVDVSCYQVGFLLSQPLAFFATALSMAMFPALSRQAQTGGSALRQSLRRAVKYQYLMSLPLALAVIVLADALIALFFHGRGFDRAPAALRLVSAGLAVIFLNHLARYVLAAIGRQGRYLLAVLAGMAVNAALCWLLIPSLGFRGACLALLGSEATICLLAQRAMREYVSLRDFASEAVRPLAAAGLGGLWLLALPHVSAWIVAVVALVTYLLLLRPLGAVDAGEIRILRRILQSFSVRRRFAPRVERVS